MLPLSERQRWEKDYKPVFRRQLLGPNWLKLQTVLSTTCLKPLTAVSLRFRGGLDVYASEDARGGGARCMSAIWIENEIGANANVFAIVGDVGKMHSCLTCLPCSCQLASLYALCSKRPPPQCLNFVVDLVLVQLKRLDLFLPLPVFCRLLCGADLQDA